ncbi:MAG: hypothetical protein LBL60_02830 [Mycoplasmataceae bacterium]|jgi:hypothetical protein|nr:hypothetical protein [Mycoplasmataceae bacterium]
MLKGSKIAYDESLVIHMVVDVMSTVPGVDKNKSLNVVLSASHKQIDVFFTPLSSILNIYDLANRIQSIIYMKLKKTFDLYSFIVNINVLGRN